MKRKTKSRRDFLRLASTVTAGTFLAACNVTGVQVEKTANEISLIEEIIKVNEFLFQNNETAYSLFVRNNEEGITRIELRYQGDAVWVSEQPIELEYYYSGKRETILGGYSSLEISGYTLKAIGHLSAGGAEIEVIDHWHQAGALIRLDRHCRVIEKGKGGFLTRARFFPTQSVPEAIRVFVPGMIYGGPQHLSRTAIGGMDTWNEKRDYSVLIREDRMPIPVTAYYVPQGVHLACFDAKPTGIAPMRDTQDTIGQEMVLEDMTLNSLGFENLDGVFSVQICSPANEGEITYQGTTYPGGQLKTWRRRYHDLHTKAEVKFSLGLLLSREDQFSTCAINVWRAVFENLSPVVQQHDIEEVTDALVRTLISRVRDIPGGGRGLPNFLDAVSKTAPYPRHNNAIMGFTGKNIESANFMLRWADDHPGEEGDHARQEGIAIIAKFIQLKVDPPEGEGFSLLTGKPELAIVAQKRVYLRSFGDDMKSLARAYLREYDAGCQHEDWLQWMERFAVWLLTQQRPDGSFPRAWEPVTGVVIEESSWTTYNPIPFFVHMYEITRNHSYLDSAVKAGEFCWNSGHSDFVFIGGTIDNPNIIDKEAGTLSLEAYLALQRVTQDKKWIERAEMAARFSETFIYMWNVPISAEESDAELHWKKGVPTIGLSIIATGHSLCDEYMAFDVDEFAAVYKLTGDRHFLEIARILLHGTKAMLSLPGRLYDLDEAGWQQEHWSLAPRRGYGLHRGWLPWVTTSHLAGIYDLKDLDQELFTSLISAP